jgi:uncharacterized protein DUF6812
MEALEGQEQWKPVSAPRRSTRVTLETSTHTIHGLVTLPAEGYRARFSDLLNRRDLDYLSLSDAEKVPLGSGAASRHAFLAVARTAILFGYPADGQTG